MWSVTSTVTASRGQTWRRRPPLSTTAHWSTWPADGEPQMGTITILDVTDPATFGRIPPCADPGFDHRSCDYWEDTDRGSKASRLSWLQPVSAVTGAWPRP